MRAVVQRVLSAGVSVDGQRVSEIQQGLVVLLGIHQDDDVNACEWMIEKLLHLRIFSDDEGKFNHSVMDVEGEVLVVSQFTLYGDCSKGRRPSYVQAARPDIAEPLYEDFLSRFRQRYDRVQSGVFRASMQVKLVNDGPVTVVLEGPKGRRQ